MQATPTTEECGKSPEVQNQESVKVAFQPKKRLGRVVLRTEGPIERKTVRLARTRTHI